MKRNIILPLCVCLCLFSVTSLCENTVPPKPDGTMPPMGDGERPPEMPEGQMPSMGEGQRPPEMPEGQMPPMGDGQRPMGMLGEPAQAPESYTAVMVLSENAEVSGRTLASTGADESALLVTDGSVSLTDSAVERVSDDSTGGDAGSFYGVGAALLCTGGVLDVRNTTVKTDAAGGTGIFAYGDGIVNVSDTTVATVGDTSGAIHAAGGGTLYAKNVIAVTEGNSSAVIRSDRGGGTVYAQGGSFTSNGIGSPAVYVTADITVENADLTANRSEALCLEGRNSVVLTNCRLSGNMSDDAQNDNTWTVILYQSMSGDAQMGRGTFAMTDGTLTSRNGGIFYTTNTESEFTLKNVTIEASEDCEYFLRCTGNANRRGWGQAGSNGANCVFSAIHQTMKGDVIWDSISRLDLSLSEGSVLEGAILQDESCAGEGGDGSCDVTIGADSKWIVTGDSVLGSLRRAGSIEDAEGRTVAVRSADGELLRPGDSKYTITVNSYTED